MGKERILPILAISILLLASGSTIYVYASQANATQITVNQQSYTINQLEQLADQRTFEELDYTGIALDDLIQKTGVSSPDKHEYTITGSDGYQKTVSWEHMQKGLLTHDGMTVFVDLPKAYRVKDVIEIEVK